MSRTHLPVLLLPLVLAGAALPAAEPASDDPARLARLVQELGSDDFTQRQQAEQDLLSLGLAALPQVRAALARATDAEARVRLKRINGVLSWLNFRQQGATTVSFVFEDKPLKEALASVPVFADVAEFFPTVKGDLAATPITLRVKEMSARSALNWILRAAGLDPDSYKEIACSKVAYSVDGTGFPAADLVALLKERLLAADFASPATRITETRDGQLEVVQDPDTHEKIKAMLTQLRVHAKEREIALPGNKIPGQEERLRALMQKKVSFQFEDMPLTKAVEFLQQHTDATLAIDPQVLAGGPPTITLRVSDMPVELALNWTLRLADLDFSCFDSAIFVSKKGPLRPDVELRIYTPDDIVQTPGQELTVANLADMLRNRIRPESWDPALGTSVDEIGGALLVVQSAEIHQHIHELLAVFRGYMQQIRNVEKDGKPPAQPLDPANVPREELEAADAEPWRKELLAKLQEKISFTCADRSLDEVLSLLKEKTKLTIVLDPKVVAEGVDKAPITLKAQDLTIEQTLRWVAALAELEYDLRNEAVWMTKRANLVPNCRLRIFYARDLEEVLSADDLACVLKDRLFPAEFADPATSIEFSWGRGGLFVMQSTEMLDKIETCLNDLRLRYREPVWFPQRALAPAATPAWKTALQQKLKEKLSFDFRAAPLADVVEFLGKSTGATWVVDPKIAVENPEFTAKSTALELEQALPLLLGPYDLGYEFRHGAFFVVHKAWLQPHTECGVYNVSDFGAGRLTELAEKIMALAPDRWGPDTGACIEERAGRLIICQTAEVHTLIQKLLQAQRDARK